MVSTAFSASAARVCGVQCVYPAVVVIFACPMMVVRASSGAPVCASAVLK